MMKTLSLLLSTAMCALACAGAERKPNFVLFVTDDHDVGDLPILSADQAADAPAIGRLAKNGIVFERAYVTSAVCTPSRYTLYTGRYPGRSQGDTYRNRYPETVQSNPGFILDLEKDGTNLGAVLSKHGYVTGHVGKFHVGDDDKMEEFIPGFKNRFAGKDKSDIAEADEFFKLRQKAYEKYMTQVIGYDWAKNIYWHNMEEPFRYHNPSWTLEAAFEFLESNKERPFFLHYNTTLVHGPYNWEESIDHPMYSDAGRLDNIPDLPHVQNKADMLEKSKRSKLQAQRTAGLVWLDNSVDTLVKKLDALGLLQDTVFIYIADHGITGKSSMYEGGIRASMLMHCPSRIPAHTRAKHLVSSADIAATIYDLAGVTLPENYHIDGKSLAPLFKNPDQQLHESVYAEEGAARAVVMGDYKYITVRYNKEMLARMRFDDPEKLVYDITYVDSNFTLGMLQLDPRAGQLTVADQLYNLKDDPQEKHNLANDPAHAETLARMKAELMKYLVSFKRPYGEFIPGENTVHPDQWNERLLKQLDKVQVRDISTSPPIYTVKLKEPEKIK